MIYCPECGSEVAPNDVFCPYCGISLTANPANIPDEVSASEQIPPVSFETSLVDSPPKAIEDPRPPTPFNSDADFQPPIAHLTDMQVDLPETDIQVNLPEKIEPELPQISPVTEEPRFDQDLAQVGKNSEPADLLKVEIEEESFGTSGELESEKAEMPVLAIEEIPAELPNLEIFENPAETLTAPTDITDQELVKTKEKFEVPSDLTENSPIQIEPTLMTGKSEEPSSIVKTENAELVFAEDEFSSTIPYMSGQLPTSSPGLGQISENKTAGESITSDSKELVKAPQNAAESVVTPMFSHSLIEATVEDIKPAIEEPQLTEPIEAFKEIEVIAEEPQKVIEEPEKVAQSEPFSIPEVSVPINENKQAVVLETEASPIENQLSEVKSGNEAERAFTNPNIGMGVDTDGRNKIKLKPLDEGTILYNRYQIERKIGGGGMGAVYLATDKNLGIKRAVKEMVQSYIEETQQEKAISDFKRESQLLTSLDHPAIPTIFDYFYDNAEGRFYLVMKFISGGDLAGRLRAAPEGRIDEVTVTDWAIQIADVLEYLHRHEPPIIYRDLKPSNIMIDGNTGKVMMIDFGIARTVSKEEKGVTAVGTMGYAPPELFSGNVEPGSDIYSLGSTMFHLLTGADPQSNPLLIFDFNKNPRPRQINPQLSDQIEQILMRSVEYSSAQRFVSAAEMRDTLAKHLDNLRKGVVTFGVVAPNSGLQSASTVAVFCGFCGQKIVATDMFCPFCGAQQPMAAQSSQSLQSAPVFAPVKLTARLMVVGTNELEQVEYSLEKDSNLLGRRDPMSNIFPEVDLSKFDPQTKISRKHARIWRDNEMYMLEDLGSSNGTTLMRPGSEANRLLPRQPHVLANGDKIRVGDTMLRFMIG